MQLTYLEAMLLSSLIVENTEPVSDKQFRDDYEALRVRGLVRFANGDVVVTVKGERALDAWMDAEREARRSPQPSPAEFALVLLLSLSLTMLIIQGLR
jgi:hypothetical protein